MNFEEFYIFLHFSFFERFFQSRVMNKLSLSCLGRTWRRSLFFPATFFAPFLYNHGHHGSSASARPSRRAILFFTNDGLFTQCSTGRIAFEASRNNVPRRVTERCVHHDATIQCCFNDSGRKKTIASLSVVASVGAHCDSRGKSLP